MFEKRRLKKRLQAFKLELQKVYAIDNKIEALIKLFNEVSRLQDEDFPQELASVRWLSRDKRKARGSLIIEIKIAGRNMYKMNRTKKGETVTADNVFLGDLFGLWTKPASYWLKNETSLKATHRPDIKGNPTEWYLIHDYQCGTFVKDRTESMLRQIDILLA